MAAVEIHGAERFAVTGVGGQVWICVREGMVAGTSLVLVLVMTEVLCGLALVPTIRRHRRPAELKRQEGEQEDGENSAHS
jgi:hypothetical protein